MTHFTDKLGDFAGAVEALIILIIGMIALQIVIVVTRRLLNRSKIDKALHTFIIDAIKVFGGIFIIVSVLSALNVNTTVFVSVLSAAGAAIAIALKDSLANIAGGILLIINKPFKKGDYVKIGDCEGTVKQIDLMTTSLVTLDNKTDILPNGLINTSPVENYSKLEERRIRYAYLVDYKTDLEHVQTVLRNVALSNPYMVPDSEITTLIGGHKDRGIEAAVKMWIMDSDYWPSDGYMNETVKLAFDEAGIKIPYPHMDVKVAKR